MSFHHCIYILQEERELASKQHDFAKLMQIDLLIEEIREAIERLTDFADDDSVKRELLALQDRVENICSKTSETPKYLNKILIDINATIEYLKTHKYQKPDSLKYFESFLKADTSQSIHDFRIMGTEIGECRGFVYAMADQELSPFGKNKNKIIHLDEKIHSYQENQSIREKDQKTIKLSRLTRMHFSPNVNTQIQKIINFANKHIGQHLALIFNDVNRGTSHICYLRILNKSGNKIFQYCDPSFGAYEFPNEKIFLEFYKTVYSEYFKTGKHYNFYSINSLKEDPENKEKESKTFAGKIRTLLTGPKYLTKAYEIASSIISSIIGGITGVAVGGIIGGAIGSVIPIVGNIIGAAVGACIGSLVGGYVGHTINKNLFEKGFLGILGVVNYLRNAWNNWRSKEPAEPKLTHTVAYLNSLQTAPSNDSTAAALILMNGDNSAVTRRPTTVRGFQDDYVFNFDDTPREQTSTTPDKSDSTSVTSAASFYSAKSQMPEDESETNDGEPSLSVPIKSST